MKVFIALALVALAVCAVQAAEHECHGKDEVFSNCATACPDTCLNRAIRRPCIEICRQACVCKAGSMRKGWDNMGGIGECVQATQCDALIKEASKHN